MSAERVLEAPEIVASASNFGTVTISPRVVRMFRVGSLLGPRCGALVAVFQALLSGRVEGVFGCLWPFSGCEAPSDLGLTEDASHRVAGAMPTCPKCKAVARPNVQMFGGDSAPPAHLKHLKHVT